MPAYLLYAWHGVHPHLWHSSSSGNFGSFQYAVEHFGQTALVAVQRLQVQPYR